MTEKFTPGEWGIVGSGEHGFVYITDNPQKEIQERHIICQVQTNTRHSTISNAALIAAAPEMYALLSLMAEPTFMGATIPQYLRSSIESVLKKARGEE